MRHGQKLFVRLHLFFYKLSGGVLGGRLGTSTVLLLTTTGRKSGQPRATPLRYLRHGDDYMVAASNWGQEDPPAWYKNLQANPVAHIQVMNQHFTVYAEDAPDELHDELYPRFIQADFRFADYPNTANRVIPIVLLRPQ
ncbi:MAG: nitroreductase family deazaflavin-dependent oxidoreductase [Anaerolineae bacterium]|nr:nitroreductase family deazaflavin-dependent oxidoreductase [Anaerolineae bacterium]